MAPTHQARAAMVTSQLVPIRLIETRPCWGRMGDGQCDACALLTAPGAEHLIKFPRLDVLVPDVVVRTVEGQDRLVCRNRRTTGAHRPAAVCAPDDVAVGVVGDGGHAATIGLHSHWGKPLCVGGAS